MKPTNAPPVNARMGRFRLPPDFKLWPDLSEPEKVGLSVPMQPPAAFSLRDAFPDLQAPAFPVTPPIPPNVATGDLITAVHENTVSTGINDLWIDLQWLATNALANPTTTKGDLLVNDGTALVRVPVGVNAQVLTADSSQALGLKWATPSASGSYVPTTRMVIAGAGMTGGGALSADVTLNANVTSVFGRTGDVVLTSAEITAAQTPWRQDINAAGFRLLGAGNVGIGNDLSVLPSPTTNIQLVVGGASATQGRVTVASTQNVGQNLGVIAFANYGITVPEKRIAQIAVQSDSTLDSGAMVFYTFLAGVNNERLRITSAGLVGVFNANPTYRLDVVGDCNITGTYRVNGVPLATGGGGTGTQTPWASNTDAATFQLLNAGRIGIGTSPPANALHLYKNVDATLEVRLENPSAGASVSTVIHCFAGTAEGYIGLEGSGTGTARTGKVFVYNAQPAGVTIQAVHASGVINFVTGADSPTYERMRITGAGRVGIGTTAPYSLLELYTPTVSAHVDVLTINGVYSVVNVEQRIKFLGTNTYSLGYIGCGFDSQNGTSGYLAFGTGGNGFWNERVRIDTFGKVGIGTTIPSVPLSLAATIGEKLAVYDGGVGANYGFGIQSYQLQIYVPAGARTSIGSGSSAAFTETLTVTSSNRVGIGTISPGSGLLFGPTLTPKLHIVGTTNPSLALQASDATAAIIYVEGGSEATYSFCHINAPTGSRILDIQTVNGVMNSRRVTDAYSAVSANALVINYNTSQINTSFSLIGPYLTANSGMYSYGQILTWSGGVAADYNNAAMQVRETGGAAGASSGDNRYRPRISFHWAGVVAAQIGMNNDGTLCAIDNPGTGYAPFQCSQLNASNLYAPTWNGYYAPGAARATAYSVAYFDGTGYLNAGWINTTSGDNGTAPMDRIYASSDGFIRYYTVANFKYQLGLGGASTQHVATGIAGLGGIYQNTTGKTMQVSVGVYVNPGQGVVAYADASSNPSTAVVQTSISTQASGVLAISFVVLPGYYYKVVGGGSISSWVEWY